MLSLWIVISNKISIVIYEIEQEEVGIKILSILYQYADDSFAVAAALLHDTVEDTNVTIEEIVLVFGCKIAYLVECLTDVSKSTDGNRTVRKELDRQHLAKASAIAKTIKLADLISNTQSIAVYDIDFARVYIKEKKALLGVLTEGDAILLQLATALVTLVEQYFIFSKSTSIETLESAINILMNYFRSNE